MTPRDYLETAGALVGLALGVCALLAIGGRVVLVPWLRTHLLEPVQETNRQVTVNGHKSADPTLKDSVHTLQQQYHDLRMDIANAAFMFEGHIQASEADRSNLWATLNALRAPDAVLEQPAPTHRKDPTT